MNGLLVFWVVTLAMAAWHRWIDNNDPITIPSRALRPGACTAGGGVVPITRIVRYLFFCFTRGHLHRVLIERPGISESDGAFAAAFVIEFDLIVVRHCHRTGAGLTTGIDSDVFCH